MANLKSKITTEFQARYGLYPTSIVRAPGRVNLIGEHTDYNDGFVLPMAIDRAMWIALKTRRDRRVVLHSLDLPEPADFSLDSISHGKGWDDYVRGMAWCLREEGFHLNGWEGILTSDIPIGAGLSSSAALEMATAMCFSVVGDWKFDPVTMAQIGQRTENEWIGANTGIMDQMISAAGKADHALLIDCRDFSSSLVPLPDNTVIVIMDTGTKHSHAESGYNDRRRQCEKAAKYFNVAHLRDVSLHMLKDHSNKLDDLHLRRARHVVTENDRTLKAADALRAGNVIEFGRLMNLSHRSMRDDFEITNDEINIMVNLAKRQPGCYGARMTGGGFGGCAIALAARDSASHIADSVAKEYQNQTGIAPNIYICHPTNGADELI